MPTDTPAAHANVVSSPKPANHLLFLDGIRALAALSVLMFHLTSVVPQEGLPRWMKLLEVPLIEGGYAVVVFIVLSGFVLMLPVIRSPDRSIPGGLPSYFVRRGRRILIPYYAALVFAIPIDIYRQRLHHEAFPWRSLIAHLFVVHDLRPYWSRGFDSPMWSVAAEWHIYFLFALVLVPVWRRFGILASTAFGIFIGLLPLFCLPPERNFGWTCPWFAGCFALGNLAAYLSSASDPCVAAFVARVPWRLVIVAQAVTLVASANDSSLFGPYAYPALQIMVALIFATIFVWLAIVARRLAGASATLDSGQQRRSVPLLEARLVRWLGSPILIALCNFSYSLYLVHFPLLSTLDTILKKRVHSGSVLMTLQITFVLPACLAAGYFFSLAFERPFMRSRAAPSSAPRP